MKITPGQFGVALILLLVGGAIWIAVLLIGFVKDDVFTVENEKKLGKILEEQSFADSGSNHFVHGTSADSCVQALSRLLVEAQSVSNYTYEVKLVNDPEVNAFALPGGYIYVNSGLLRFCQNPGELAAVLAHEMGHVEKRHGVNKLIKEIGITALLGYISNGDTGSGTQMAHMLTATYFDREQEKEADTYALDLLKRAGISPIHMEQVFERMKFSFGDKQPPAFLSTHPDFDERIAHVHAFSDSTTDNTPEVNWDRAKKEVEETGNR